MTTPAGGPLRQSRRRTRRPRRTRWSTTARSAPARPSGCCGAPGFGPRPGDVAALAALGLDGAVTLADAPERRRHADRPEPNADGSPLAPEDQYGHDHLFWLDRMVRSDQQLVERMALIFHDWFGVSTRRRRADDLMLAHIDLYRRLCLGSFRDLLLEVTRDPAMLLFLNGANSDKNSPNENFGREIMELFTLGADRGAYTEDDVREAARALTGWRADYVNNVGWTNFRYEPVSHDYEAQDDLRQDRQLRLARRRRPVPEQPLPPLVLRPEAVVATSSPYAPDAATQASLEKLYVDSDWSIRAVLEAILRHPALHTGPPLVKPPVVFSAGLLRARSQRRRRRRRCCGGRDGAGQRLFYPPNVSGWNDNAWLDTSTLYSRWRLVYDVIEDDAAARTAPTARPRRPPQALDAALAYWGDPPLRDDSRAGPA